MPGTEARRSRLQIYLDVLRAIHGATKTGGRLNKYRLERTAGLTSIRLKRVLHELQDAKLIDEHLRITQRGYSFLSDVTGKVIPVLSKYGLWQD